MTMTRDRVLWRPVARLEKYDHDDLCRLGLLDAPGDALRAEGLKPYERKVIEGNLLMNAGINRMISLLIGGGGQAFTTAFARLGVGDGVTAPAATQTDLVGANKFFKAADSGYPNGTTAQTLTMQSTYDSTTANFAWQEWGIDLGGGGAGTSGAVVGAPLLNRKVASMGTKSSGTWVLTVTITIG